MKLIQITICLMAVAITAGCHPPQKDADEDFFTPSNDHAALHAFYDREAAAATHADPTLYPAHFTGTHLNSLGEAKLDSLLAYGERPASTDIYLSDSTDTPEHRSAITHYLTCHGCKADEFAFVTGPNPNSHSLASHTLNDLDKLSTASSSPADSVGGSMTPGIAGK